MGGCPTSSHPFGGGQATPANGGGDSGGSPIIDDISSIPITKSHGERG
jgi:hypothetical protein